MGIDLIDLGDPLLHSREKALRFVAIPSDRFPESTLSFWYLWAAKEAIFKSYRTPYTPFLPLKISVQFADDLTFSSSHIRGRILLQTGYLVAIAHADKDEPIFQAIEKKEENPSLAARNALIDFYRKEREMEITIGTDEVGLPAILPEGIPVSFSHHGRFVAFAF